LIEVYGAPEAIRMDNGPEMTSETFTEWAKEKGIALLFIQPGKPNQNAFVERFNRSFRDEVLDANLFNSIAEAQEAAEIWVMDYNEFRPHDSLGDKTPMEFMPWTLKQDSLVLNCLSDGGAWGLPAFLCRQGSRRDTLEEPALSSKITLSDSLILSS
jgi:hypothetical protein